MRRFTFLLVAALVALLAAPAAARPTSATVQVSTVGGEAPQVGSYLIFSGCGYVPGAGVNVLVSSPTATTFMGEVADAGGCFSTADLVTFIAYNPGQHEVATYQSKQNRADAQLVFTVAP